MGASPDGNRYVMHATETGTPLACMCGSAAVGPCGPPIAPGLYHDIEVASAEQTIEV